MGGSYVSQTVLLHCSEVLGILSSWSSVSLGGRRDCRLVGSQVLPKLPVQGPHFGSKALNSTLADVL